MLRGLHSECRRHFVPDKESRIRSTPACPIRPTSLSQSLITPTAPTPVPLPGKNKPRVTIATRCREINSGDGWEREMKNQRYDHEIWRAALSRIEGRNKTTHKNAEFWWLQIITGVTFSLTCFCYTKEIFKEGVCARPWFSMASVEIMNEMTALTVPSQRKRNPLDNIEKQELLTVTVCHFWKHVFARFGICCPSSHGNPNRIFVLLLRGELLNSLFCFLGVY